MATSHVLYDGYGRGFEVTDGDTTTRGGCRVGAIGASITVANGERPGNELSSQGYLAWAALLSAGAIKYAGHSAAGGVTSSTVLSVHLPALLALPGAPFDYVVVDAFTNDMSDTDELAQAKLNLAALVAAIRAEDIEPVLVSVPPRTDGTVAENLNIARWNAHVARYAERHNTCFVDWHSVLVDPATNEFASGLLLSGDVSGLHPSPAGAKLMGQALADVLVPASRWRPKLRAVDTDPLDLVPGGMFLTDTAGVGDGWTSALSEGDDFAADVDDAASAGNWQTVEQTDGLSWLVTTPSFTLVPGHRYRFSGAFDVVAIDAAANVGLQVANAAGGAALATVEASRLGWTTTAVAGAFELDFESPAAVTAGLISFRIEGGAATARIARIGLVDLTALGAASL